MNQILYTGKGKSNGPASLKSILKTFGVSMIALGVIFLGEGSYALYENYKLSQEFVDTSVPQIAFEQEENNAVVTITHNKGINKVRYHWNDEVEIIIDGNDERKVILDTITIPAGINTLYVQAIDVNGRSVDKFYEFAYDGICIDLSVIDNTYMKITATDVKGLTSLTFKWNSEDAVTAYSNTEDPTVIEQTTEIPTGLNTLSITAVNTENKTLTKTQDIKGVHPPQIRLFIQDDFLIVHVTDEEGIDKIIHQINVEEEKVIEVGGAKEYKYKYNIADRDNVLVTITAIDIEGVGRTYKGKNY